MIIRLTSKSDRTKRYLIGASASLASQGITAITSIIITGILARYFLPEEFGVWSLTNALFGLFMGLDFGFGNATKNKLSELYANGNSAEIDKKANGLFLSSFFIFFTWAAILAAIIYIFKSIIPWSIILKTNDTKLLNISIQLFITATIFFVFNSALRIYTHAFYAYQESQWSSFVDIVNKVLFFVFVLFAVYSKESFWSINIAYYIVMSVTSILGMYLFFYRRKWKQFLISKENIIETFKLLWNSSIQFALLQLVSVIMSNIDMFIVSNSMGLASVGDYSLVKRIYLFISVFQVMILFPLWGSFTESMIKKDYRWVRNVLNKVVVVSIFSYSALALVLFFFGNSIIYMWSGKIVHLSMIFLLLGVYFLISAVANCYSVFLNSIDKLKWQISIAVIVMIIFIPLAKYLMNIYQLNGLVYSMIIVSIPGLIYLIVHTKKLLSVA